MSQCLNCDQETHFLTKEKRMAKFCCHACYLEYKTKNKKVKQPKPHNICIKCGKILKSSKSDAKICAHCEKQTIQPILKMCAFCGQNFLDKSRSKNAIYCSKECNVKAGCRRYRKKLISGYYPIPPKRDRSLYRKTKYKNDINFKLSIVLRTRLRRALGIGRKMQQTLSYAGCTIAFLKLHIESQWSSGMTWENWSKTGWHIDHIKPLASFNLADEEQIKQACHYTNLQPLWAKDNQSKGNR